MPLRTLVLDGGGGSVVSDNFLITNGVRQCGILSSLFLTFIWTI